jgi:hypothetical protein
MKSAVLVTPCIILTNQSRFAVSVEQMLSNGGFTFRFLNDIDDFVAPPANSSSVAAQPMILVHSKSRRAVDRSTLATAPGPRHPKSQKRCSVAGGAIGNQRHLVQCLLGMSAHKIHQNDVGGTGCEPVCADQ